MFQKFGWHNIYVKHEIFTHQHNRLKHKWAEGQTQEKSEHYCRFQMLGN